jgi:hypothetical protein
MRSRACVSGIFGLVLAVIACDPAMIAAPETGNSATEIAYRRLGQVDGYALGAVTYQDFRRSGWPSFTILHMDVRSGPPVAADAVVVLGVAGGAATSADGAESHIEAVLAESDERGLCIVRGWLDGQRHVAALPTECPAEIRAELDAILQDFDALTGGDAIWVLRFHEGLLRSKRRL